MACQASVGWRGFLLVLGDALPLLTSDIRQAQDIVASQPLTVESPEIYRSEHNYVVGKTYVNGSISCEVNSSGAFARAFINLLLLAISSTNSKCTSLNGGSNSAIQYCPGGGNLYTIPSSGKCVINGFSIKGNPGGLVNASFELMASAYSANSSNLVAINQFESVSASDDGNPLPYYKAQFTVTGSGDDSNISNYLTDFNINVSSEATPIYGFCSNGTTSALDIRLGLMKVTGDFTYYSPTGVYSNTLAQGARIICNLGCCNLAMPNVVFYTDDLPTEGRNSPVFRKVSFRAMGTGGSGSIAVQSLL